MRLSTKFKENQRVEAFWLYIDIDWTSRVRFSVPNLTICGFSNIFANTPQRSITSSLFGFFCITKPVVDPPPQWIYYFPPLHKCLAWGQGAKSSRILWIHVEPVQWYWKRDKWFQSKYTSPWKGVRQSWQASCRLDPSCIHVWIMASFFLYLN